MWTFREQSFVPHGLTGQVDPVLTPVLLGWQAPPEDENDVLINLAPEVPAFFSRFRRLAEPLDHEPGIRPTARIFYDSRADWSCEGSDLPCFEAYPT